MWTNAEPHLKTTVTYFVTWLQLRREQSPDDTSDVFKTRHKIVKHLRWLRNLAEEEEEEDGTLEAAINLSVSVKSTRSH